MPKLEAGEPAPDFTLPAADGSTVRLSDLRGRHVVVYFYPKASTPGCTTEACDFRDNLASLQGAGYTVLGVSPDRPGALGDFAKADRFRSRCSPTPTTPCWSSGVPGARRRCTARR